MCAMVRTYQITMGRAYYKCTLGFSSTSNVTDTVPTTPPLHHSLFTVPSTRTSCLDHASSHLCSCLGNRGILFYIGCSYIYIFYHIFVASGLGCRLQIWAVAEITTEFTVAVTTEVTTEVLTEATSGLGYCL